MIELELLDWELEGCGLIHKRCRYATIKRDFNSRSDLPCYTFRYYEPKFFDKPVCYISTFTDQEEILKIHSYISKLEEAETERVEIYIRKKLCI